MRRKLLPAAVALLALAAGARPAAAEATCSSPLQVGEQLPQPQVDIAALSAQVGCTAAVRFSIALCSRRALRVPQITKLSTFSEAPAPAVTRIVYTPQDMAARECATRAAPPGRCVTLFQRTSLQLTHGAARHSYVKSLMRDAGLVVRCVR
jgi:hypothetical protein